MVPNICGILPLVPVYGLLCALQALIKCTLNVNIGCHWLLSRSRGSYRRKHRVIDSIQELRSGADGRQRGAPVRADDQEEAVEFGRGLWSDDCALTLRRGGRGAMTPARPAAARVSAFGCDPSRTPSA